MFTVATGTLASRCRITLRPLARRNCRYGTSMVGGRPSSGFGVGVAGAFGAPTRVPGVDGHCACTVDGVVTSTVAATAPAARAGSWMYGRRMTDLRICGCAAILIDLARGRPGAPLR